MGFMSTDCTGPRHQLKDVLFLFAFNVPLAEFADMLLVIILHDNKSLSHMLRSGWDRMIFQNTVKAGLTHFAIHQEQISDYSIGKIPLHHNRPSSILYGWCDTGG